MQVAIDSMEPNDFADMFYSRFPEESARMVELYKPEDVVEFVKQIPGAEGSAILRRDGADWIENMFSAVRTKKGATKDAAE